MTTTTMNTQALHQINLDKLASSAYADGTYNLLTAESVEFNDGYQVSFCQIGDNYTADDYDFIVAMFAEISVDGIAYAGKFECYPEISFHIKDKGIAIKYAKMFNQISIWDWKNADCIATGGTGRR